MAGLLEWMDNSASIVLLDFLGIAQHQLKDRFLFNFLCLGWFFFFFVGLGGCHLVWLVWLGFGLVYFYFSQGRKIKKQPFWCQCVSKFLVCTSSADWGKYNPHPWTASWILLPATAEELVRTWSLTHIPRPSVWEDGCIQDAGRVEILLA